MGKQYILAIDQGTTGTRAFIFDDKGKVRGSAYQEFTQYYPKPGWVEHDAEEIWRSCKAVIKKALKKAKINPSNIIGIGITNQRETTVLWDRKTGKPLHRAIVWQCRRTHNICQNPKYKKKTALIRRKTGLLLDPYFSGTKIKWLFDQVKNLRAKANKGEVCFGTIDSWIIWNLTKGLTHATDMTNASRTLLFNIRTKKWDKELLNLFNIPDNILPKVLPSGADFGATAKLSMLPSGIPIRAVIGDQQAALYGQGCFEEGSIKNTYGTGCFLVLNTGKRLRLAKEGLLSTICCDFKGNPVYAIEGAIFVAGSLVQWLRDGIGLIKHAALTEKIAKKTKDTCGVYVVPAFTGLGAPHWNAEARGIITGLTRGANRNHIIKACLEAIAYQTRDVFDIMQRNYGKKINLLKVDGGASQNKFLMQFQSDILNTVVQKPVNIDTTVLGAAHLAGVSVGLWKNQKELQKMRKVDQVFKPKMSKKKRKDLSLGWQLAVKQANITQ